MRQRYGVIYGNKFPCKLPIITSNISHYFCHIFQVIIRKLPIYNFEYITLVFVLFLELLILDFPGFHSQWTIFYLSFQWASPILCILNLNWNTLCPINSFNWNSWNTLACKYPEFTSQFHWKFSQRSNAALQSSIVLQIVGNGSNFRAKSFPCNVNTGCLFARGGAACGNAHFFFHTKNKYLSNAEQYKLEKSHRKCPWIRQCCLM